MILIPWFAIDRTVPSKTKIHVNMIRSNDSLENEERQFTKILSRTELKRLRWRKIGGPGITPTSNNYINGTDTNHKPQEQSFFSSLFSCCYAKSDIKVSHNDAKNIMMTTPGCAPEVA